MHAYIHMHALWLYTCDRSCTCVCVGQAQARVSRRLGVWVCRCSCDVRKLPQLSSLSAYHNHACLYVCLFVLFRYLARAWQSRDRLTPPPIVSQSCPSKDVTWPTPTPVTSVNSPPRYLHQPHSFMRRCVYVRVLQHATNCSIEKPDDRNQAYTEASTHMLTPLW
jgi:hypothetical protein